MVYIPFADLADLRCHILFPAVLLNQDAILSESMNPSLHMFWRVNGNSSKPVSPHTRTAPAMSGLKSATPKLKKAFPETI